MLDFVYFKELDTRTLHQTIKAMLVNTVNDCIKFECEMDTEMVKITRILQKENLTEVEELKLKHAQERLKTSSYLARVSENALENLIYEMMLCDEIKYAFKQDIPELYEGLYYLIDIEEDILEVLVPELSEQYETNYKTICSIISNSINEFVENAEVLIDDLKDKENYEDFINFREDWRAKREANTNE